MVRYHIITHLTLTLNLNLTLTLDIVTLTLPWIVCQTHALNTGRPYLFHIVIRYWKKQISTKQKLKTLLIKQQKKWNEIILLPKLKPKPQLKLNYRKTPCLLEKSLQRLLSIYFFVYFTFSCSVYACLCRRSLKNPLKQRLQ